MSFSEYMTESEQSDIVRYIQYKAHQSQVSLDEAAARSLGRLFGQIHDSENIVAILTAFRSERTLQQNRILNRQLANDFRQFGWGYTPVLGGFLEKTKDNKDIRVHEESFFINATGSPKEVLQRVATLLGKYQQESALVKLPGDEEAHLLSTNGSMTAAGRWHADPKLMAVYYTRLKKGSPDRQFTFEAAGDDSRTTRMAVDAHFKNPKG